MKDKYININEVNISILIADKSIKYGKLYTENEGLFSNQLQNLMHLRIYATNTTDKTTTTSTPSIGILEEIQDNAGAAFKPAEGTSLSPPDGE